MDWKNQQSTDQANRFAAESNQGWSRSCRGHAGELLRLVRDPEAVRDTAPVPVPRLDARRGTWRGHGHGGAR